MMPNSQSATYPMPATYGTVGMMQPMAPYQMTGMAPQQPEGMQMMFVPMQNGTSQPAMMMAPSTYTSPAMVVNSSTSTSPAQMPATSQELSPGMQNVSPQTQMVVIGVMPAPVDPQPQIPPEQANVANAGRQMFSEALSSETFEAPPPPYDGVVRKEAVVLSSGQPLPSPGSALHGNGNCNPCAWYYKPKGCMNGKICSYCHLCPEGELKNRKKAKVTAMRMGALEPSTTSGPPAIKLSQLVG
jgi:hypothetical protein